MIIATKSNEPFLLAMKAKTTVKKFSFTFILLSCLVSAQAQRSDEWLKQHDHGKFHEGTYTREVSTSAMELVSLTAYWEPFEFGKRQNLKVRFYSPASSEFQIRVQELSVKRYYWLESKPQSTEQDWQEVDGWQVDRWLSRLKLSSRSLGLLVQIGPRKNRQFLPAWIYHNANAPSPKRYIAQIRLGINAENGTYNIYPGKRNSSNTPLKSGRILGRSGGTCFPVVIRSSDLPVPGWYTMSIDLKESGDVDQHSYSFEFYHWK